MVHKNDIYLNKLRHKEYNDRKYAKKVVLMPSLNLPTAPTPGVPSDILSSSGQIASAALINIGGEIRRSSYGRTITPAGMRLGKYISLKSEGEMRGVLDAATKAQINQYIADRLAEGYTRTNQNTLEKDVGGGTKQVITIDWSTGALAEGTAPTAAAVKAQQQYEYAVKQANKEADERLLFGTLGVEEYWKNKALLTKDPIKKQEYLEQAKKSAARILQKEVAAESAAGIGTYTDPVTGFKYSVAPSIVDISKNIVAKTTSIASPVVSTKKSGGGGSGVIIGYTSGGSAITSTSPVIPGYVGVTKPVSTPASTKISDYTDIGSSLNKMLGTSAPTSNKTMSTSKTSSLFSSGFPKSDKTSHGRLIDKHIFIRNNSNILDNFLKKELKFKRMR